MNTAEVGNKTANIKGVDCCPAPAVIYYL